MHLRSAIVCTVQNRVTYSVVNIVMMMMMIIITTTLIVVIIIIATFIVIIIVILHTRHKELDRYAREKETAVVGLKESQVETERKLQEEFRRLEGALEAKEVESRRETWEHQDALKDKEMLIER